MAGIAGVISDGTDKDSLEIMQRMSEKLSHRGEERTFSLPFKNNCNVIIKTRSHPLESFITKSDSNGILIVEGGEQVDSLRLSVNHDKVEIKRRKRSMKPFYYASTDQAVFFSSERKALWEIGIQNAIPLQPGQDLKIEGIAQIEVIEENKEQSPAIAQDIPRDEVFAVWKYH